MKIKTLVDKVLEWVMIVFMIILVVDVLWQVISRYLNRLLVNNFGVQIPAELYSFTDELAGFLLIWVALLGAAYVTGKKQHLAIDLLVTKLGDRGKVLLSGIINVLILLFSLSVMIVGGIWLVSTRFYLGQLSPSMELPVGIVYLIVPLSGFLIGFYAIVDMFVVNISDKKN